MILLAIVGVCSPMIAIFRFGLNIGLMTTYSDVKKIRREERLRRSVRFPDLFCRLYLATVILPQVSSAVLMLVVTFGRNTEVFSNMVVVAIVISDSSSKFAALEIARYFDACRPRARFGRVPSLQGVHSCVRNLGISNTARVALSIALLAHENLSTYSQVCMTIICFTGAVLAVIAILLRISASSPQTQGEDALAVAVTNADATPHSTAPQNRQESPVDASDVSVGTSRGHEQRRSSNWNPSVVSQVSGD